MPLYLNPPATMMAGEKMGFEIKRIKIEPKDSYKMLTSLGIFVLVCDYTGDCDIFNLSRSILKSAYRSFENDEKISVTYDRLSRSVVIENTYTIRIEMKIISLYNLIV